ncbi:uncharacterized protein DFL_005512 [Arthrobotrys flagrans]|uniref:Uncharacterized protein n=1 Tax=Arthrobotrys flagrans TaxID=97331 RepID=A0A436ZXL9_ARTFL|nr:hypothetical protein DFL_005512 [Arthrobotrys flagrans]
MLSRLASLNRTQLRSLRGSFIKQRQYISTSAISRQTFTGLTTSKPPANDTHAGISIIVAEFKKADIRITKMGVQFLKIAYASGLSSEDVKDSWTLWGGLREEVLFGSTDSPDDLYGTLDDDPRKSPWRSGQPFRACMESSVFKVWEALHSRSDLFREIIENVENNLIGIYKRTWCPYLRDYPLWEWLKFMLTTGIIEAEDVDNLPEPYKLKDMKAKATELQSKQ